MVPLPSRPLTVLPDTVMEEPPYSALEPPATSTGVTPTKSKDASTPPWPRLQMAITGSTTGTENVNVFNAAVPPSNSMIPLAWAGSLSTITPSANVLDGDHDG